MAALAAARAQSDWRQVAVPVYTPSHLLQGLHRDWTAPQAGILAAQAPALTGALAAYCGGDPSVAEAGLDAARRQWRATASAWERLSAVAVGPVVERRSPRQIDFTPTRPALIERAIRSEPRGPEAMALVGTPAKGLPALEWLLWTRPAAPGSPACRYAVELALDIEREAGALHAAFQALAGRPADDWDGEAAVAGMNEFVNQWVGGIERLRWAQMEKPLRAGARQSLPRAASGTATASWHAQWETLRALSVWPPGAAPVPGQGRVPIETYLRGRGLNPLADRLVRRVQAVASALRSADAASPSRVLAAARELAALKRLAEAELAPALNVSIGFSDADGD